MNDLAIVILNWNGKKWLKKFLPSVIKHAETARVIVADNCSTDDSIEYLKTYHPEVEIVQNDMNGGFAKGYNEALSQITATYYLLLNSDIEVSEGWLLPLYEMIQQEGVAACQPKIKSYSDRESFEHAGACGGYIDYNYFPFCRGRILNEVEKDHGQYDSISEVFWASGAALMIRSSLFHKLGGFDEEFFAHMEEIDLCWRLKKRGYKIMVNPESTVYHVGGGTLAYNSPKKVYLNFRNNLLMLIKNHDGLLFPKLFYRMSIDGIAAIMFLLKGELKSFGAVFKAHMYIYGHFRSNYKKRKEIREQSYDQRSVGRFRGNLIWNFYVKGNKKFSALNQRLFD